MINLFTLILLFLGVHSVAKAELKEWKVADLSFLSGDWVGEFQGAALEEHFSSPKAGIMIGYSRRVKPGGDLEFFEFMRFQDREGKVYFETWPNSEKTLPAYPLVELKDKRAVFENQNQPFPKTIVFESTGSDSQVITVKGLLEGKETTWVFKQKRKK